MCVNVTVIHIVHNFGQCVIIMTITYDTHNLSWYLTLVTALRMYNENGEKTTTKHSVIHQQKNSRTYTWWYTHKHVHVWRKNAHAHINCETAQVISVYAAFSIHFPFLCYLYLLPLICQCVYGACVAVRLYYYTFYFLLYVVLVVKYLSFFVRTRKALEKFPLLSLWKNTSAGCKLWLMKERRLDSRLTQTWKLFGPFPLALLPWALVLVYIICLHTNRILHSGYYNLFCVTNPDR